jgi:S1-C subfamily serine protease
VQLGDTVFAAADPFGSSRTFAQGTVMALPTASCYQADLTGTFVHSSMAIGPGAVGGALVNAKGEVIGILVRPPSADPNVRLEPYSSATYALPIDTALGVGAGSHREALESLAVDRILRALAGGTQNAGLATTRSLKR